MAAQHDIDPGPDFALGVDLASLAQKQPLRGHVGGEGVLLTRLEDGCHAVAATCTHYGADLASGLVVGEEIRCACHHASFSLRTGAAIRAPGVRDLPLWRTEVQNGKVFVHGPAMSPQPRPAIRGSRPNRIVIIGGGAAGFAAAERLHALGFDGELSILSADRDTPYDRPNLSKGFLAGTAPKEWIPLTEPGHYARRGVAFKLKRKVVAIETRNKRVVTQKGGYIPYDCLLLATGASARRDNVLDADFNNVFTLRSLKDAERITRALSNARCVVVVGSGFIGLEAASALIRRGLNVHVVTHEAQPMETRFGQKVGRMIRLLHEAKGVRFHFGSRVAAFDGNELILNSGLCIRTDAVIVGIGAMPRARLAMEAGLNVRDGILVDHHLQTSVPGIYAAGDVSRYPANGESTRTEHWVHAMRQGELAAENMLGHNKAFQDVPFFWTEQYGLELRSTGWGGAWDDHQVEGSIQTGDLIARYFRKGQLVSALTLGRDLENLKIERQLEQRQRSAQATGTACE